MAAETMSWLQLHAGRRMLQSQLPALSRLSWCPISPGTRECWECRLFTGDLFNWFNRILIPRARASLSLDVFT